MIKTTFLYFGKKYGSGYDASQIEKMKSAGREVWAFEIRGDKIALTPSILSGECLEDITAL